ncbi:hypothetical protein ACHAPO_004141 [Fusarium lateritium]
MNIIRHDIDPYGDLSIVLKHPNTLNLMPDLPTEYESFCPPPPYDGWIINDPSNNEEFEVEFRVSSLHMIRSSTFFKKMLGGPWKEAVEATASSHLRRVSATDWNYEALMIVLNIIHKRNRNNDVPHDVNTFLLAHIAVIVDYYQCEKCTHIKAAIRQWAQNGKLHRSGYVVELYISLVFSWHSSVNSMTTRVLRNNPDLTLINVNDLPMAELLSQFTASNFRILTKSFYRDD